MSCPSLPIERLSFGLFWAAGLWALWPPGHDSDDATSPLQSGYFMKTRPVSEEGEGILTLSFLW